MVPVALFPRGRKANPMNTSPKQRLALLEVAQPLRAGMLLELPAGLKFTNEYNARRSTLANAVHVRVLQIDRDDIYWRSTSGNMCSAKYRYVT